MMLVPKANPETIPDADPIGAIAELLLTQVPPAAVLYKLAVAPSQTELAHVIGGGAVGYMSKLPFIRLAQPVIKLVAITSNDKPFEPTGFGVWSPKSSEWPVPVIGAPTAIEPYKYN